MNVMKMVVFDFTAFTIRARNETLANFCVRNSSFSLNKFARIKKSEASGGKFYLLVNRMP